MRPARLQDCELFFNWANDPLVRANAFNQEPIRWQDHLIWFQDKINSPTSEIFVLGDKNDEIGQIRFDLKKSVWEIDYSIDSNFRGKGYGKEIVRKGLENMISKFGEDISFKAKVKRENISSLTIFKKLGFLLETEGETLVFYKK